MFNDTAVEEHMFQFTHPGGVRRRCLSLCRGVVNEFQFTHPGGVRRSPVFWGCSVSRCFNSRTREGCDTGLVLYDDA